MNIEQAVPLARFTTLGAGGPARAFARPETLDELEHALAWAREQGLPVATIGLGSNLLVADQGVDALARATPSSRSARGTSIEPRR